MRNNLTSPEAFEDLVLEHQAMVFRTLTRMTGRNAPVEDLAQEVFLRLYRALPEFRGEAALSTYLYRIVINVAQDEWKRRRREQTHIASAPVFEGDDETSDWLENFAGDPLTGSHARSPQQLLEEADLEQAVEAELLALPHMERAVLVLYHQEERSYEGIAEALQLPINTVRTHLHRGRKRLSERLSVRLGTKGPINTDTTKSEASKNLATGMFKRRVAADAAEARV